MLFVVVWCGVSEVVPMLLLGCGMGKQLTEF